MELKYSTEITCPKCNDKQVEEMPKGPCCNVSLTCKSCGCVIKHKEDGSCVYCGCGDVHCPETQKTGGDKCVCIYN